MHQPPRHGGRMPGSVSRRTNMVRSMAIGAMRTQGVYGQPAEMGTGPVSARIMVRPADRGSWCAATTSGSPASARRRWIRLPGRTVGQTRAPLRDDMAGLAYHPHSDGVATSSMSASGSFESLLTGRRGRVPLRVGDRRMKGASHSLRGPVEPPRSIDTGPWIRRYPGDRSLPVDPSPRGPADLMRIA